MAKMSRDEIKKLQEIIGTDVDGIWGPKSRAAYSAWLDKSSQPSEDTFVSPEGTLQDGNTFSTNLGDEYRVAEELGETKLDPNYGRDPNAKSGFDPMDSFVAPQMDNLYDKSTRIAEIQRRLDEIKREKEKYDMEGKMGEYKFLYDADPSTYTTYKQNLRSNEQTKAIRKASEDATKASQAQTAWRQLLIDEEQAKYDRQAQQNKATEAKRSGNSVAYSEAMTELSRLNAKMNRLNRDKEEYRNRFAEMLGLSKEDLGAKAGDWNQTGDDDFKKLQQLETMRNGMYTNINDLRKRQTEITEKQKADLLKKHNDNIAEYRNQWSSMRGMFSPETQKAVDEELTKYEDAIPTFKKSQPTKMTPEKFAKLNYAQLLKIGSSKALSNYKKKGFKNADLDKAIDRLASQGK